MLLSSKTKRKRRSLLPETLVVEKKFIRNLGRCGHIEDIVVDKNYQKMGFGGIIVKNLMGIGDEVGCYKLVLDCSEKNVGFYGNCGFVRKEVQMVRYREKSKL